MPSTPLTRHELWWGGLCALAVLAIWTSFILVARHSAVRTLTPFDIAWLRFVFSGAVGVLIWWGLARRGLRLATALGGPGLQGDTRPMAMAGLSRRSPWLRGALLTLTGGVGYCALAYSGFFFAPAAHAAVLMPGSLPLWTALLAVALLGDRLTWARSAGLALITAGDALVGGHSLLLAFEGGRTWIGDALFLTAGCSWALYGVLCRRWQVSPVGATLAVALGALISYVPLYGLGVWAGWLPSALARAPWDEIVFQAVYQGGLAMLVSGLAYTRMVQTFGPLRATMVTSMVPALAALAAVPVLGEALGPAALAGLACVTLGLLLGLRATRAPAAARPVPAAV